MTTQTQDALREALEKIARWHGEFPDTGRTWDGGTPVTYAALYGSNGERDYMRQVALDALALAATAEPEQPVAEMVYFKRVGSGTEDQLPVALGTAAQHVNASLITRIEPLVYASPQVREQQDKVPEHAAIDGKGGVYHNIAQTYRDAEEAECLHMWLDEIGVPDEDTSGETYSLVGRVKALLAAPSQENKK